MKINKSELEKLVYEGYSARMLACYYGVSRNTITNWIKQEYGKTYIEFKREIVYGKTKN